VPLTYSTTPANVEKDEGSTRHFKSRLASLSSASPTTRITLLYSLRDPKPGLRAMKPSLSTLMLE